MSWRTGIEQAKMYKAQRGAYEDQQALINDEREAMRRAKHEEALYADLTTMGNIIASSGEGPVPLEPLKQILRQRVETQERFGTPFPGNESLEALQKLESGDPQQIGSVIADLQQAKVMADRSLQDKLQARALYGGAAGGVGGAKSVRYTKSGHILQTMDDGGIRLTTPSGERIGPNSPAYESEMRTAMQSGIDYAAEEVRAKADAGNESTLDYAAPIEEQKITGKGKGERSQQAISLGLDSAKALPTLRRALSLLDTVETGGIDAARFKAKQLFGVESANEAELNNLMDKAVITQLKAAFGAAFSVKEGEWLKKAEAGYGKSVAGNRRIIMQTLKLAEKYTDVALQRAIAAEDYDTARELIEFKSFTLPSEGQGAQSTGGLDAAKRARLEELRRKQAAGTLGQ